LGESILAERIRERKTKTKSYGSQRALQILTVGFRTAAAANPNTVAQSSLALVTAAHCIGQERPIGIGNAQILSPHDEIEFKPLDGVAMAVKIDPDVQGWTYSTSNDLAVIPFTAQQGVNNLTGLPLASSSALTAWQPLYLFGINPVVVALNRVNKLDGDAAVKKAVTLSLGMPCRIHGIHDGQILHNCETEKQMSGSPIFVVEGGIAKLAAVHTAGDTNLFSLSACGQDSEQAANQGVLLRRRD
jgi:hypothetical protein